MVVHFPREEAAQAAHHDAKALFDEHHDPQTVRKKLEERHDPHLAADTLHRFDESHAHKREHLAKNDTVLSVKETLERVGFGLGNLQLLNVLLITVIPNYLLAGIVLAARSVLSGLVESGYGSFGVSYDREKQRSFWFGSLLGYSFILAAVFITLSDIGPSFAQQIFTVLFSLAFLSIGVLGALYLQSGLRLKAGAINKDRMRHYLKWISYYGIVLVAGVFLLAGVVLDLFADPITLPLGRPLLIYGYAVLLFATGIIMIVNAYLSTRLTKVRSLQEGVGQVSAYLDTARVSVGKVLGEGAFVRNLLIAGTLFYSSQLALNYFLGIHLYDHFDAFTPVAVLFSATLLTMFVVPLFFDRRTLRLNGRSSLFMFGVGLALMVPLAFALVLVPAIRDPLIGATGSATAVDFLPIGVAGSSVAGIAYSRLALDTLKPELRGRFMRVLGVITPIASAAIILVAFALRSLSGTSLASFAMLAAMFFVVLIIFTSLIAGRLEQQFEQQALTNFKTR